MCQILQRVIPGGLWNKATARMPQNKQQITVRPDPDVIRWFKRAGKGYSRA
jgi:uncharacterized protein (DUF4415 family)